MLFALITIFIAKKKQSRKKQKNRMKNPLLYHKKKLYKYFLILSLITKKTE